MRRIILGAIWLTGFLAVLLSWGMMYGRAQGEGPSRMIGVAQDDFYSKCQLALISTESGTYKSLDLTFPYCWMRPVIWSSDQAWFYFLSKVGHDPTDIFQLERVDKNFTHHQVLATGLRDNSVWLSPDARYIIYREPYPGDSFRVNLVDGNITNITILYKRQYSLYLTSVHSSNREWVLAWGCCLPSRNAGFRIRLDGARVEPIPNSQRFFNPVILWSNAPEWLVVVESEEMAVGFVKTTVYKIRPDGSDWTLLASNLVGLTFTGWTHQSGVLGFQEGDTFSAMLVDTGAILWQLTGVEKIYLEGDWDAPMLLDEDWVHFKMLDGRLARCRVDGSDLTFYDPSNYPVYRVWGWSPDGEWVWFETDATNPDLVDVVRVHANTGKPELIVDETYWGQFMGWSPDYKWAYFNDEYGRFKHVRTDGRSKPEIVLHNNWVGPALPLTWTPPYQAEWQPTHTLAIGIGLMSFSTLLSIFFWRRRWHSPSRSASP